MTRLAVNILQETKVPSLPTALAVQDPAAKAFIEAIRELTEVREGIAGDPLDQNVTFRDLYRNGMLNLSVDQRPYIRLPGDRGLTFIPLPREGGTDFATPPPVTGLAAVGALINVIVSFNTPAYHNHAYTEIWRSGADDLGTAVLVGTTEGSLYADPIGVTGATRYYWARNVSTAGREGPFNAIPGTSATTGLVLTGDIADASITTVKLADGSVTTVKYADASVTTQKIGDQQVSTAKIGDAAVTTTKIGDNQVTTAKVNDLAITTGKFADLSVTTAKLADTAVTTTKITDDAVTTPKIIAGAVTTAKVAANAIDAGKLNVQTHGIKGLTFTNNSPVAGSVAWTAHTISWDGTNFAIGSGSTSAEMIWLDRSVSTTALQGSTRAAFEAAYNNADGDILLAINSGGTAETIYNATLITPGGIKTGAVVTDKLAANAVVAGKIATNAIIAGDGVIGNLAVDTAQIANVAITNGKIGLLAVDQAQIANGAIVTAKIGDLQVTTAKINNLAVSLAKIDTATITNLSALSADMGTLTAGTITLNSSGHVKSGQTDWSSGDGWFLGRHSAEAALSIGNSAADKEQLTYKPSEGLRMRSRGFTLDFKDLMTSLLTASWRESPNPKNFNLRGLAWGSSQFVAVGAADGTDAYIVTSPDGVAWAERANAKNFSLNDVVWSGSLFVAVGNADGTDAYILTSSDGITWTERANPKNFALNAVTWNGSIFVAVGAGDGTDAYIVTSSDGITWTERANPKNFQLLGVTWNGSIFVAGGVADGTDAYLITSSDGSTWTERSNPGNHQINCIAWSSTLSLFVAGGAFDGTDAYLLTSPDGTTWTERSSGNAAAIGGAVWNGNCFVACGLANIGGDGYLASSVDGITWVERDNPRNIQLFDIAWNGNFFVSVGGADGTDAYIIKSVQFI